MCEHKLTPSFYFYCMFLYFETEIPPLKACNNEIRTENKCYYFYQFITDKN